MSTTAPSNGQSKALASLERRAQEILKARPAYREMVEFYLTVFRRQIEWRDRLVVRPAPVTEEQRRQIWGAGRPLVHEHDPGIDPGSLADLWTDMKTVFRQGNPVLSQAIDQIDEAERAGAFAPATWLWEQRPDQVEMVSETARQIGIEETVLGALARAVTLPHWEVVASDWLPRDRLDAWRRFHCPVCGGPPGIAETRAEPKPADNVMPGTRRVMHCPFCGACWVVPAMKCPSCESTRSGDAKYYYTAQEPELRIEFCKSCKHYIKVVDSGKIADSLHVGLELLTTAHLDAIAQDKNLTPLRVSA